MSRPYTRNQTAENVTVLQADGYVHLLADTIQSVVRMAERESGGEFSSDSDRRDVEWLFQTDSREWSPEWVADAIEQSTGTMLRLDEIRWEVARKLDCPQHIEPVRQWIQSQLPKQ